MQVVAIILLAVCGGAAYGILHGVAANIAAPIRTAFMADWFAHLASYLSGIVGAAFLCAWVWKARQRPAS